MIKKFFSYIFISFLIITSFMFPKEVKAYTYTPLTVSTINLKTYMVFDSDVNPPTGRSTYFLSTTTVPSTGKLINPVTITGSLSKSNYGQGTFGTTVYNFVQSTDNIILPPGKSYTVGTLALDSSYISFSHPGIYRAALNAITVNVAGFTADTQKASGATTNVKYIDFYIKDNNGSLELFSYVIHDLNEQLPASMDLYSDKSDGFVNEWETASTSANLSITGNQASRDKYFQISVAQSYEQNSRENMNLLPYPSPFINPGALKIDISNAEASPVKTGSTTYTTMTNPESISYREDLQAQYVFKTDATSNFYLRDGQSITINGIPLQSNSNYNDTLTVGITDEGYKITVGEVVTGGAMILGAFKPFAVVNSVGAVNPDGKSATVDIGDGSSVPNFTFTATRNGTIPTGIIFPLAGTLGLIILASTGLILKSKFSEEN